MKINDSIIRNWIREAIQDFVEEKSNETKNLSEAKVKYDHQKMMKLIKKDKFLQRAFKSLRGKDEKRGLTLFQNFILGDRKMEKNYVKI